MVLLCPSQFPDGVVEHVPGQAIADDNIADDNGAIANAEMDDTLENLLAQAVKFPAIPTMCSLLGDLETRAMHVCIQTLSFMNAQYSARHFDEKTGNSGESVGRDHA